MKNIVLIAGDGIGPEVVGATKKILSVLAADKLNFIEVSAGYEHFLKHGETISSSDLELCKGSDAVIYGANTNPAGESSYKSLTLTLRKELGLFANIRPAKSIKGVALYQDVDLVIVRENSECLYIKEESEIEGGTIAIRRITEEASTRIIRYALNFARDNKRKRVTIVHKANVLRKTCGLFRKIGLELAKEYPDLTVDERFVDAIAMELVMKPKEFDVIVTTNLFGDILSDLASGLVGGLGVAPGANIGLTNAVFEPIHGSAPDIAGKNIANPTATILSASMMLAHIGLNEESSRLSRAVLAAIESGYLTRDLGGKLGTDEFAERVIGGL